MTSAGSKHAVPHDVLQRTLEAAERLGRWPLFQDLDKETLFEMTRHMAVMACDADEIVLIDGEICNKVYLIVRGFASLRQISLEGREHVLEHLGPGRILNLISAVDGKPQIGTVQSLTDLVLYTLARDDFVALMQKEPKLALAIAQRLAHESRQLSETARGLALDTVRMRLASFLLTYAEDTPPQKRWTQEIIAAYIGTVRDVVGRILRDFIQEDIIRRERGQLVIIDRAKLEKEASGSDR